MRRLAFLLAAMLATPIFAQNAASEHSADESANNVVPTKPGSAATAAPAETQEQFDARMKWWREARFGMFIHWGLYAIPGGVWGKETGHGEWIMTTAKIEVPEYEKFLTQFNPVKFNADEWAKLAADAGMKYVVITSKHHDGFALFDSKVSDYDVMATPFKRDILKELSEAVRKQGLQMCWYHSIMDWHHPDYWPRREWEKRPGSPDHFDRYVEYMKGQLRELLTNYGPIGVLWFDGEWESTWNHERGQDLYNYVRGLQPSIIVNNRVDVGREGMAGLTREGRFAGDFGTPEQEVPPGTVAGDWESCITMNGHWGYNFHDRNFKSTKDLIRMLCDIASKGGNFLLNVGPQPDGQIPEASVQRLREMGAWMKVNGEAIYATTAGPFKTPPAWGRCTQKAMPGDVTRLYLHVFDWPKDGRLFIAGLLNEPAGETACRLLSGSNQPLDARREGDGVLVMVPPRAPDENASVVVLDVKGKADVSSPPTITAPFSSFVDALDVTIASEQQNAVIHYTTDGSKPTATSGHVSGVVRLSASATVKARSFRDGKPVSPISEASFEKVTPRPADTAEGAKQGLRREYFEGKWNRVPDFDRLTDAKISTVADFTLEGAREEHYAIRFRGFVHVPTTGVYRFHLMSDDGSKMWIGRKLVVTNDGPHGPTERSAEIALAGGLHAITVGFFQATGGKLLEVSWEGPHFAKQRIPAAALQHLETPTSAPRTELPTPSARQLAWQQIEFHGFIHFGPNTFSDREWGEGTEDPAKFNPTDFDAVQWVRAFKAGGAKQIVLTSKHHDGFCLWPSSYTKHSVASSPWRDGKGDVVGEVAAACRAEGLKFGVYLSPWDRHEPTYGDSPRYNEHFKKQLAEVLTKYGPIHEVWFDGACGEGPNGKRQEYDWPGFIEVVREHAPDAVIFSDAGPDIRWVGNEAGFAGETCWSTLRRDEFYPGTPKYAQLTEGHEDGTHWVPAECDVSIRPGWFYHPAEDSKVKSLEKLMEIYYASVGRNGVLLLNVPPDRRGRIHEIDEARLAEFGRAVRETFATNLARGAKATMSAGGRTADAAACIDGDWRTAVLPGDDAGSVEVTVDAGRSVSFDRVVLQENIAEGQRVRAFHVEVQEGAAWREIARGTTVGYKRILCVPRSTATAVRVTIEDARSAPRLSEIGLYLATATETAAAGTAREVR